MARQIKTFKRKYRKLQKGGKNNDSRDDESILSEYVSAHKTIQKSWQPGDPNDHKDLIKNLCIIISQARLIPGSADYSKICEYVRESMPIHLIQNSMCKFA